MSKMRVVQWTTGNVGRRTLLAALDVEHLEVVGCYVTTAGGKAGSDVADLVGLPTATGVVATDDIDALLALRPDCVIYTPKWNNVDEMVRILASGANIVTTAGFITGHCLGEGRQRILDACAAGQSSIFGSGANPGWLNLLSLAASNLCDDVQYVSGLESVDSTGYDSPETEMPCGFGRPVDDPALPSMARSGTAVFEDAVRLTADALGVALDEVRFEAEFAQTTTDLDLGSWTIGAGCVAGIKGSWQGVVDDRVLIELKTLWRKGETLEPDWEVEHGYVVEVRGMPSLHVKAMMLPPPDFQATTFQEYMVIGMVATGLPAVHAIPHVVAALPGIVTYLDLPLVTAKGFAHG